MHIITLFKSCFCWASDRRVVSVGWAAMVPIQASRTGLGYGRLQLHRTIGLPIYTAA